MLMLATPTEASIWQTVWDFAQQVATFAVALIAIWATAVRPYLAKKDSERKAEIIRRDTARRDEIKAQVEAVVKPVRDKVEAIHRTTHINGGKNNPPTLRDEVNNVGKQVETAIRAVGAVAVNQAQLSSDFQDHVDGADRFLMEARRRLREQGIELPELGSPSQQRQGPDTDI